MASIAVFRSVREGFGLTVAEAMWKGTPVIGGDVGGIRLLDVANAATGAVDKTAIVGTEIAAAINGSFISPG
jgi:trehalose synthase